MLSTGTPFADRTDTKVCLISRGTLSSPRPAFSVISRKAQITLFAVRGVPILEAKIGPWATAIICTRGTPVRSLEPGHLVSATAASAAEANNCRRADLAVIHPRCCHSRPASESPAITTSPNGMER